MKISPGADLERASLATLTASEVLPSLRSGKLNVTDYIAVLLNEAEKKNPELKAFISLPVDKILDAAQQADRRRESGEELGPLFGVPISLKDLIVTKDMPTTFGTDKFSGFISSKNAPLVDRLIEAGAIIFGKNNTQEWAFGSTGYNSHYGQQLNPYDKSRIAGGSSGGSAAAVAARILPIAIGSDTAASIRVPAAYTGLYGLRPTINRYDINGVAPIAPTLDTVGPIARSVDDLALIDSVLSGEQMALPRILLDDLRLGVPNEFFYEGVSEQNLAEFKQLLQRLRQAGVELIEADLIDAQKLTDQGLYPILFYEAYPSIVQFLANWGNGTTIQQLYQALGDDIKVMWDQLVMPDAPGAISSNVYTNAIEHVRLQMQERYRDYFKQHRVKAILFPATAGDAPLAKPDNPQETVIDGKTVSVFINDRNSSPGALAGQPGVVLPMAMTSEGLPLGVSIDGQQGADRELLAVAKALASVIPELPMPAE